MHRFPANMWRRYDRLRRYPSGYLVFGDAICSTNPAYALGMSMSALQAMCLRDALAHGDRNLPRRFFRATVKPISMGWQATLGGDLALPQVPGRRPLPIRLVGRYSARVLRAAGRDTTVARQFLRIASLQDPSTRLFRPAIVWRVVRHGAGAGTADRCPPARARGATVRHPL